jgi:hypothetical protein
LNAILAHLAPDGYFVESFALSSESSLTLHERVVVSTRRYHAGGKRSS